MTSRHWRRVRRLHVFLLQTTLPLICALTVGMAASTTLRAEESAVQRDPKTLAMDGLLGRLRAVDNKAVGRRRPVESVRISTEADGYLRLVAAPPGYYFGVATPALDNPDLTARNFIKQYKELFGVISPAVDFKVEKSTEREGRHYIRLQQTYDRIPIFAAQVVVQLNDLGGVEYVLSDIACDVRVLDDGIVSTTPAITAAKATKMARDVIAAEQPDVKVDTTTPNLYLFDPSVLDVKGPIQLVWRLTVWSEGAVEADREVFLDAQTSEIVRAYPLAKEALNRSIRDAENDKGIGSKVRREGAAPCGIADADAAYDFAGDAYNFYENEHGRDGLNDRGRRIKITVRRCEDGCPWRNARWHSFRKRLYFGEGFTVDDVLGHEYTHGVTHYCSDLVYENQSGAIDEAFSDIWGEFIDLGNGAGLDTVDDRWKIGEDLPHWTEDSGAGGAVGDGNRESGDACSNAVDDDGDGFVNEGCPETGVACGNLADDDGDGFRDEGCPGSCRDGIDNSGDGSADPIDPDCYGRNMRHPPSGDQPDRLHSPIFRPAEADPNDGNDYGWVHFNSGVINKLAYLLTDGDTFQHLTITGMGIGRIADLFYEVNVAPLITSTANFLDLGDALEQAAVNLGWSDADRNNLFRAILAVQIHRTRTIFVDSLYVGPEDGTAARPFNTVTEGYTAARSGDQLVVRGGRYDETLIIEKLSEITAERGVAVIGD